MKVLFVFLLTSLPHMAFAGVWTKLNETTLKFEGTITPEEPENFKKVFNSRIKEIHLDSTGGATKGAIPVAIEIAKHDIKIVVVGHCHSSCANYFFIAGTSREIRGGLVGFHGNVTACALKPNRTELIQQWKEQLGVNDQEISEMFIDLEAQGKLEQEFLEARGVSQELFDISCTADKGLGDGQSYTFLAPLPLTFLRFGIRGVIGEQNLNLLGNSDFKIAVY